MKIILPEGPVLTNTQQAVQLLHRNVTRAMQRGHEIIQNLQKIAKNQEIPRQNDYLFQVEQEVQSLYQETQELNKKSESFPDKIENLIFLTELIAINHESSQAPEHCQQAHQTLQQISKRAEEIHEQTQKLSQQGKKLVHRTAEEIQEITAQAFESFEEPVPDPEEIQMLTFIEESLQGLGLWLERTHQDSVRILRWIHKIRFSSDSDQQPIAYSILDIKT